ncbi:MAG: cob(I)yrinic acid a,c-diamide adenosyltransferase, partial [Burkholderiales bacterium]
MGQRLTAIATRTGDDGSTGLGDGSRTSKDSLRVHAMGEVDELNSQLGVLRAQFSPSLKSAEPDAPKEIDNLLHEIQHDLFDLGGELCIPGYEQLQAHQVLRLDEALALHNASLPRLAEFILPGGSSHAAQAHVCRAV